MSEQEKLRREYVYIMGSPISPIVKIGRSVHPKTRLLQVQETVDFALQLMWTTPGGNQMERGLHAYFASQRRKGEWFELGFANAVPLVEDAIAANSWETESFQPVRKWHKPYSAHTGILRRGIHYMRSGSDCAECGHPATNHGEKAGRCWVLGEWEWMDCPCTAYTAAEMTACPSVQPA